MDLNTRLIDITVGELAEFIRDTVAGSTTPIIKDEREYAYGIAGIMEIFNCKSSKANQIKQSGVIDDAITQSGRKIVIDKGLALELMRKHKLNS